MEDWCVFGMYKDSDTPIIVTGLYDLEEARKYVEICESKGHRIIAVCQIDKLHILGREDILRAINEEDN